VVVPEWLSGMTRNHVGSARAGSNPADHVFFLQYRHEQLMLNVHNIPITFSFLVIEHYTSFSYYSDKSWLPSKVSTFFLLNNTKHKPECSTVYTMYKTC
jgi:hypothetical protein